MSVAKKQRGVWTGIAILAAVACFAGVEGTLSSDAARVGPWIAAGSSLAILVISIAAWNTRRPKNAPGTDQQGAPGDLSAHLLTIQEEERKNLSRDLHDGVGQMVTALKMELARLKVASDGDAGRLVRARALADETLRTIRNISLLLRPTALDDLGLEAALQWHAEDFSRRTSVRCEVRWMLPDDQSIPEAVKTCIYRVVQEALNNCEKHAGANRVVIEVGQNSKGIAVSVTDDGRGIASDFSDGLGILGMKERAGMLGGQLRVASEGGRGTTVSLLLPCSISYLAHGSPVS